MASKAVDFTERLPLELRRETYRLVLQRDQAITLTPPTNNQSGLEFDGSLFRVNKAVSSESLAVFFEANAVHVQPHQISDFINRHGSSVQRIHIQDKPGDGAALVSKHLEAAAALLRYHSLTPRLRSVTFECEGLHLTVRELVTHLIAAEEQRCDITFSADDLQCVNVGTYLLRIPSISQDWHFSYTLFSDLWNSRSVQREQNQPSSSEVEAYFSVQGTRSIPEWANAKKEERFREMHNHNLKGLAYQVACYSAMEDALPLVKSREAQLTVLRRFELIADWRIKRPVLEICLDFAGRIRLRDVGKEHSSDVLEWATELLAPNTRDYAAEFGDSVERTQGYSRRN